MASTRTALIWPALTAVTVLFLVVTMVLQYQTGPTAAGGTAAATAAAAPTAVDVELSEFAITPDPVTVPAGVPIALQVRNAGALPHDLHVVDGPATPEIAGGGSETLELEPMEPGTYELLCGVPGHAASGMTAALEVTDDVAAAPVADSGGDGHGGAGATAMSMTPEEMVEHHDDGIAKFLEGWGGTVYGNDVLEPTIEDDGTKVFTLTADEIEWETKPGVEKPGMAYNGQIPGPMIRASVGDDVKIVLTNDLEVPTAIHSHGLVLPNAQDGVPGITQDPVMPGETFTYEFTLRNPGSHMYHSHFDSAAQVPAGLLGAFIVDDPERPVAEDVDYTMILNDGPLGFTLNGKDFPATEPIVAAQGETVRVRFMNEGLQIHPMHLHGMPMTVIEKDGYPLPQPYRLDTLNIAPGERYDVVVEAEEPGVWAFHCHILNHAEGADGMFGMVTALVVEG